jgi:hypothetical protein
MSNIFKKTAVYSGITIFLMSMTVWADDSSNGSSNLEKSIQHQQQEVQRILGSDQGTEQTTEKNAEKVVGQITQPPAQTQPAEKTTSPSFSAVTGLVLKEKDVSFKHKTGMNRVILIKGNDGTRLAVDLGPSGNLTEVSTLIGKNVRLEGQMVRIGNRMVLMATKLTVNGKTTPILRVIRPISQKDTGTRQTDTTQSTGASDIIVLLKTDEGNFVTADIGPSDEAAQIPFALNEPVEVTGTWVRVGNQPVLLTKEVTVGGQTTRVLHPIGQIWTNTNEDLTGVVIRSKDVTIKDTKIKHKVVMISTEKNGQMIVDLGPSDNIAEASIKPGKTIHVEGWLVGVGDRLVVLAKTLKADDKTYEIRKNITPAK